MDDSILLQAQRQRFEHAVLPLLRGLRAAALRLSRDASEADDLLQETLLRAWRFWPRYQERDSCRAFLQRVLANTFISSRRKRARDRALLASAAQRSDEGLFARSVEDRHDAHELDPRLRAHVDALPRAQQQVLWLVDVEERSYRDAAVSLGWPIGTVMSRLHRARRSLQAQLAA